MALNGIPYLKAETFLGLQTEWDKRDAQLPLFRYFPRRQVAGERVTLRVKTLAPTLGVHTSSDGPATLVRSGQLEEVSVEPLYARHMRRFSNSELSLFASAGELVVKNPGDSVVREANAAFAELTQEISAPGRERMHAMLAGALLGEYVYPLNGYNMTVNYGLTALTPPGTVWTDPAATIIDDIAAMKREFRDNASGVSPDTAFCHPDLLTYFMQNTEFRGYVAEVPALLEKLMGFGGDIIPEDGLTPLNLFGLTFVPVPGSVTDMSGSTADRWPVSKVSMCALRGSMQPVLEHLMVKDSYNPTAAPGWKVWEQVEPAGWFARHADNGAALIRTHNRVQTWEVG